MTKFDAHKFLHASDFVRASEDRLDVVGFLELGLCVTLTSCFGHRFDPQVKSHSNAPYLLKPIIKVEVFACLDKTVSDYI